MERKTFSDNPCAVARSLDVLGDWWTPQILRECFYGVERFSDLQRQLGIGRNILTRRLQLLVDRGLLTRERYHDKPVRHGYHLTEMGYGAVTVLLAMMAFGERWMFEGDAPIGIYHRDTGARVRPVVVDAATGAPLDPRDLQVGPDPGDPDGEADGAARSAALARRAAADDSWRQW